MTTITITRQAKCKDCKYCKMYYTGVNLDKRHKCSNPESKESGKTIRMNDLVCDKWELI